MLIHQDKFCEWVIESLIQKITVQNNLIDQCYSKTSLFVSDLIIC